MSYENTHEEKKDLDTRNKQLLNNLVQETNNLVVGSSAATEEVTKQGKIIDNVDKNYNIADANLK